MKRSPAVSQTRGFTLVELLLAAALGAVVLLALTSSMVQGLKIFNRLNAMTADEAPAFFLERLTRDLKNAAPYSLVPFSTSDHSVTFASLPSAPIPAPVEICYRFDPETRRIYRSQNSYPFDPETRETETAAEEVERFALDLLSGGGPLPARVTVSVKFGSAQELKKQILIPAAYASPL